MQEYEYNWSFEKDENIEKLIVEFPKLMESKAEKVKYQLIEASKLAIQVKSIIKKQAKETKDQIVSLNVEDFAFWWAGINLLCSHFDLLLFEYAQFYMDQFDIFHCW